MDLLLPLKLFKAAERNKDDEKVADGVAELAYQLLILEQAAKTHTRANHKDRSDPVD